MPPFYHFKMLNLPFLEKTSPPPFYQSQLSDEKRLALDKAFIGNRSQAYYLRQFAKIDKAGRLIPTWNWTAFVATFGWLLYRKRYLDCLVYCVAGLSFVKLNVVVGLAMVEFLVIRHLPETVQMNSRIAVGVAIWAFWAIHVGRWANAYYYRMARREIADALEFYPDDTNAQKAYLARHGGVSVVGLGVAFGLYVTMLSAVAFLLVPIWAKHQEQEILYQSYHTLSHAKNRLELLYQKQGHCPTHVPMSVTGQAVELVIVDKVAGVATDCAIQLTIQGAGYPVRYLNGQTMVMYRQEGQVWRCQSSFSQQKNPKGCL